MTTGPKTWAVASKTGSDSHDLRLAVMSAFTTASPPLTYQEPT